MQHEAPHEKSLRDHFAGLAMHAILRNCQSKEEWEHAHAADRAYAIADAMLRRRNPCRRTGEENGFSD